jgi:hypothetical protein
MSGKVAMSETFDPYYKWLGISPAEQPPTLYRLLGVNRFESDPEVIESAAEQRISHLRSLQSGPHGAESQRLLNELASAKLCLLKPDRKLEYDNGLRMLMASQMPVGMPPNGWPAPFPPQPPSASTSCGESSLTGQPSALRTANSTSASPSKSADDGIELEDIGIASSPSIHPFRGASLPPILWIAGPTIFAIMIVVAILQIGAALNRSRRSDETAASQRQSVPNPQVTARSDRPNYAVLGGSSLNGEFARPLPDVKHPSTAHEAGSNVESPAPAPPATQNDAAPTQSAPDGSRSREPLPDKAPVTPNETSVLTKPGTDPFDQLSSSDGRTGRDRAEPASSTASRQSLPGGRAFVPSEIAQQDALREVRNILRDEFVAATTPPFQVALARKLERLAAETRDDATTCYVLRSQAIELAIRGGDADLAADLATRLVQSFDVDVWPLRLKAWSRLPQFLSSSDNRTAFVRRAVQFANEATGDDRYEIAIEMAALANNVAAALKDKAIRDQAGDCADRVKHMQTAAATASAAIETLLCEPTNPQANLTVGKFRCFDKQEWVPGLPYLARGSDVALRELALRELQAPTGSPDQLKLADAWWDLGEKSGELRSGTWRSPLHARGIHWYREAMPALSGLALVKAQKRAAAGTNSDGQSP